MTKEEYIARVREALVLTEPPDMTPEEYMDALDELSEDIHTMAEAQSQLMEDDDMAFDIAHGANPIKAYERSVVRKHLQSVPMPEDKSEKGGN